MGGSRANPAKKREIEDNSRKIGALFAKLNSGDISKNAADKLVQLCQALDNGDFGAALAIQVPKWRLQNYLFCQTMDGCVYDWFHFFLIRYNLPLASGMSATSGLQLSNG